jgi:hypothetical protein
VSAAIYWTPSAWPPATIGSTPSTHTQGDRRADADWREVRKSAVSIVRPRRRRYGLAFQKALKVAWEAAGYICSERLQPFLPDMVPLLKAPRPA